VKILKLSTLNVNENATLSQYTGNPDGIVGDWKIILNKRIDRADAWWVIEGSQIAGDSCEIPQGMLFFGSDEVTWPYGFYSEYNYRSAFLNQFDSVYTCHDYYSDKTINCAPFLPWMINSNHGPSVTSPHPRDINHLKSLESIAKTKSISVFCSRQGMLPTHRLRIRFVEAMKSHFGSELDWYGNGVNTVKEKWDGLASYKFSLVLENQSRHNVITEKIHDSYLALSYPIYWGAPNITDYFDKKSLTQINIEDLKGSINTVENLLNNSNYNDFLPALRESRNKVLENYHYLKRMIQISSLKLDNVPSANKEIRSIRNMQDFYHLYPWKLRQLEKIKGAGGNFLRRIS